MTVVRNAGYTAKEFNTRERHNERKNETYHNGDIETSRADKNIYYQRYVFPDGTPETYEQSFNRMVSVGRISKRGLKPDAKVFAELIFAVNTDYFEENGGYDFAKKFFDEAYRCAVKEVGDERYILSAVMHADERNKEASERLGRDVYHYHLHVIYIPVVEKKVYYRKDCKDKEKAGQLKEVIQQISHSKKWPIRVPVERNGKTININSYSLLQDRFYEHMKTAGFPDIERGERGSTVEHLDVLDYKIQQDKKRLDSLSEQVEKKENRIEKLDEKIAVKEKAKATIAEIEAMGHKLPVVPGVHFADDEAKRLKSLAKKGVGTDKRANELKQQLAAQQREHEGRIREMQSAITSIQRDRDKWKKNYERLWDEVKDFIHAIRKIPNRLRTFLQDIGVTKSNEREASR